MVLVSKSLCMKMIMFLILYTDDTLDCSAVILLLILMLLLLPIKLGTFSDPDPDGTNSLFPLPAVGTTKLNSILILIVMVDDCVSCLETPNSIISSNVNFFCRAHRCRIRRNFAYFARDGAFLVIVQNFFYLSRTKI